MYKKPSGALRRKLEKEKNEKQEQLLKKVSRLSTFFQPVLSSSSSSLPSSDCGVNVNINNIQSIDTEMQAHQSTSNEDYNDVLIETEDEIDFPEANTANEEYTKKDNDNFNLNNKIFESDPSKWDLTSASNIDVIIKNLPPPQNFQELNVNISKRTYEKTSRYITRNILYKTHISGTEMRREWIIYSNSKGLIYCIPCLLFSKTNAFTNGFNDWKNPFRVNEHERSIEHRTNMKNLISRSTILGKIDTALHQQYLSQCDYWKSVLHRVVDVIKFLVIRGLAFRGSHEVFGSLNNGNYLGILELLAAYDPFLKEHIKRYGNKGSGKVSYLSKDICNEVVHLMAKKVLESILDQLKIAKYYSIIIDSTPDITHIDQLTVIVRYVLPSGTPVERFIKFIANAGHKAEDMEKEIIDLFEKLNINISNCRGQSYDNARNMSGIYSGLQARIKERNDLALYIPCAAHSLNLVGVSAAECCVNATSYFMFLEQIYVFLSNSTGRWNKLKKNIEESDNKVLPKGLSATRWSARADACTALKENYSIFRNTLEEIATDQNEKNMTRVEADALVKKFDSLEIGFMTVFWEEIMNRFNKTSKILQTVDIDLQTATGLLESLKAFVENIRENFNDYEERGKILSKATDYKQSKGRSRRRKLQFDERKDIVDSEIQFNTKTDMRVNTFNVILDQLVQQLNYRLGAYKEIKERFGFLKKLKILSHEEVQQKAKHLQSIYNTDIEDDFPTECSHFKEFLSDDIPLTSITSILQYICEKEIISTFPNINIALRIFLSIAVTNCTAERSFSLLKRIKTALRNSLEEERLGALALLNFNNDLVTSISFENIIKDFAVLKSRKQDF